VKRSALRCFATFLLGIAFVPFNQLALAQSNTSALQNGALPDAKFSGEFEKQLTSDPFFSWQGRMRIDGTAYRRGRHSSHFTVDGQTVGARRSNAKVNISGNSYILEGSYRHTRSENFHAGFIVTHLSSHLAQDVFKLIQQDKLRPPSLQATDLNIAGGEVRLGDPMAFQLLVRIQPVSFHYRGGYGWHDRILFFENQVRLWSGQEKGVGFTNRHEVGKHSINDLSLRLSLLERNQREGRLQFFVGYLWSHDPIEVSPNLGWTRRGLYTKLGLNFYAR